MSSLLACCDIGSGCSIAGLSITFIKSSPACLCLGCRLCFWGLQLTEVQCCAVLFPLWLMMAPLPLIPLLKTNVLSVKLFECMPLESHSLSEKLGRSTNMIRLEIHVVQTNGSSPS